MTFGLCLVFPCCAELCFTAFPSFGRRHINPVLAVWPKDPVEASEVNSGFWHQGSQPGNKVSWFKDHMGSAITVGRLEFIVHLARRSERQTLLGHRRAGNVATQSFQLIALMGFGCHSSMKTETGQFRHAFRTRRQAWRGWNGLKGEHFSSSLGTHSYPVSHRMGMNVLHRVFAQPLQGESAVVFIPFKQAPPFQCIVNLG